MEELLPKHNCKNFVKKVFLVLDGEISENEKKLFIEDIQRCKGCLEHYHIEKYFKEYVYNRYERKCCSDELKENILSEIGRIEGQDSN